MRRGGREGGRLENDVSAARVLDHGAGVDGVCARPSSLAAWGLAGSLEVPQAESYERGGTYSALSSPPGRQEVYNVSSRLLTLPKFFSGGNTGGGAGTQFGRRDGRTMYRLLVARVCVCHRRTGEGTALGEGAPNLLEPWRAFSTRSNAAQLVEQRVWW